MLLSVSVALAVNCFVWPSATLALAGVTVMELIAAAVTVSVDAGAEVTVSNVAVIDVMPTFTAVARPFEPEALLIVATEAVVDDHVAKEVSVCVVLFTSVPVAVNCWVVPFAIVTAAGVTVIVDTGETMSVAVPVTPV